MIGTNVYGVPFHVITWFICAVMAAKPLRVLSNFFSDINNNCMLFRISRVRNQHFDPKDGGDMFPEMSVDLQLTQ
jgi:hypothetical protein